MKAISMKMTQEQFESVKDELVRLTQIELFNEYPYLVTNFENIMYNVSNVEESCRKGYNRTVYEQFDKEILFDALDIKPRLNDLDKKIADVIECAKGLGLNVKVIFE